MIIQLIASGLVSGCIYALIALGLIEIYKATGSVNFAQGEMGMVTAYLFYSLFALWGVGYWVAFGGALILAAIMGVMIYIIFMRKVAGGSAMNELVLTIGILLMFHGIAGLFWGQQPKTFPTPFESSTREIFGVFLSTSDIFVIGIAGILATSLAIFFKWTNFGLMMRATSQDPVAARVVGIRVVYVYAVAWAVGSMLGGVAAMLTAPYTFLSPIMMIDILILGFAGAVLGGFTSLPGAVVGGLIIGVFENFVKYYWAPEMKVVAIFGLIIATLYVMPQGLFGGEAAIKKV